MSLARQKTFEPDQILDRTIGIFLSRGYDETSIQDIVDVTKVLPGSLYNAFGSKKSIYLQALERFIQVSQFNVTLSNAETAPPRATIQKLFSDLVDGTDKPGAAGYCLVSKALMEFGDKDKEVAAWLQNLFARSEAQLERLVERGQELGEISKSRSARELSQFLASSIQGMQMMSRLERDEDKLRTIANLALTVLDDTN